MNSEQWEQDGDCTICRKQKYCSKPCGAWKRKKKAILMGASSYIMQKLLSGGYEDEEPDDECSYPEKLQKAMNERMEARDGEA